MADLSPYFHLPVAALAPRVVAQLEARGCVVVTAPPGAGKSTLLPLLLLPHVAEGKVLLVEPRRLAAVQVAGRMAAMLGERVGQTVGYQVRFDRRVGPTTRIEVVTEGILARRFVDDALLDDVGLVIFDEFHERSLTADACLALACSLRRSLRPELRLLLMSATIDAADLCRRLDAPLVESEGRLYPVEICYAPTDAAPADCAEAVAEAVGRAHRLHEGSILAFLPGQADIERCRALLADSLGTTAVLPLYGMLDERAQRLALQPSAEGERKVVLATPVAETSLTIEGITVVVDSGFCREMVYDPRTALSRLQTVRISADRARQRSGRAGRLAPGVCYRLWTSATDRRLSPCRQPEVLTADLAPMLLAVAAWGGDEMERLPWITPPPAGHLAAARSLLTLLQAFDASGRLTPHGRSLAALPCHPRMARLLLSSATPSLRALAADIAALLEEKDIMPEAVADADLTSRLALLRRHRAALAAGRQAGDGRLSRLVAVARQYRLLVGAPEDNADPSPYAVGALVAAAYPERIACPCGVGRLRLASGETVLLDEADNLSAEPLLAVAAVGRKVFLAAPLDAADAAVHARWREVVAWDGRLHDFVARREQRIGSLVLSAVPLQAVEPAVMVEAVAAAAPKEGAHMFCFTEELRRLQQRLAAVAVWHPEWELPAVDDAALMASVAEWLPLYIGSPTPATLAAALRRVDLAAVVRAMLGYDLSLRVDRCAPSHLVVPTGSRLRLDYRPGADAPVLSVRLQECFGLTDTPCVDEGRRPVLMELLSPGYKPVQLTADLRSFWQSAYFEVRKELRRRYPKHSWPDSPLEAEAVRGVKRR